MHGYKSYEEKENENKATLEVADKEIPNISTLHKKDPDSIYTSREFTFGKISKPVNSSIITSHYLNDDENNEGMFIIFWNIIFRKLLYFVSSIDFQDSQLVGLEVLN